MATNRAAVPVYEAVEPINLIMRQGFIGGLRLPFRSKETKNPVDVGQWRFAVEQLDLYTGVVSDGQISNLEPSAEAVGTLSMEPSSVLGEALVMIPAGFYNAPIAPESTTLPVAIAMIRVTLPTGESHIFEIRIAICDGDRTP